MVPIERPDHAASALIGKVFRMVAALHANTMDPAAIRASMVITLPEAFALLDYAEPGRRWVLPIPVPYHGDGPPPMVTFDLILAPQPGLVWARLWGVSLIIEDTDRPAGPTPTCS
ncbi:hypothetical protein ACFFMN_23880 [Planobispora siamensis]|uniref:Uncharacterized protein n=1 Tax=Planobispora siamensis TaxID=936338 RepID=A0A8J3SJD5_9ACTN|nr:hypothetical protein [Planobispora siamensis]GIH95377.1 hypothetical protein Psi01_60070 [Planobispora siamensis]